jgi:beta-lactamase regulating signal transducer with metallopeptidase domain
VTSVLVSIQWISERVLNSIPEGLLIAAFAWILLRLAGRQNSGTRFAVWFAALLAIGALPFVPAVQVGGSVARAVHAEVTLPSAWAGVLFGIWAVITLIASIRLGAGLWRVRSLRRNAAILSTVDPVIRKTVDECKAIRTVEVCTSSEVRVPTAIGFLNPAILIPEWAVAELSPEELRAIILHEFAHLRRRDDWTNLLQKVIRTFFFFHPAVLWIERRLSLEREMACDDAVLAETENPHLYARCLVSLAERSFLRRSVAMAQAAISRAKDTSLRLAQILDVDRPKATRVFSPAVAAVAAFAGLSFVAIPNAPRFVAFQPPVSSSAGEVASSVATPAAPHVPASMVVPASAHSDLSKVEPGKVKFAIANHRIRESAKAPRGVLSKRRNAAQPPLVVEANAKPDVLRAPQYLVVTQSTEYVRQGSAVVTYSVWRVTLVTRKSAVSKAPSQT